MSYKTEHPSPAALAAAEKIRDNAFLEMGVKMNHYYVALLIDAEFAALRARLERAEEALKSAYLYIAPAKKLIELALEHSAMSAPSAKPGEGGK